MKVKHLVLSILIVLAMCSMAPAASMLTSVELQAVGDSGAPIDPPLVFRSDSSSAFLGVKNNGAFLSSTPQAFSLNLEPGAYVFTLFASGVFSQHGYFGVTLGLTDGTNTAELSTFNANASLALPFLPADEDSPYVVLGGRKIEVLSFTVSSVDCAATTTDIVGSGGVVSDSAPDTTAKLVLLVTSQSAAPEVQLDIKPGSDVNPFNYKSHGQLPAALLCFGDFEAGSIDIDTITLNTIAMEGAHPVKSSLADVNGDGIVDLMLHFNTEDLAASIEELAAGGASTATLTLIGATTDGVSFESSDTATIVPKKYKEHKQHKVKKKS